MKRRNGSRRQAVKWNQEMRMKGKKKGIPLLAKKKKTHQARMSNYSSSLVYLCMPINDCGCAEKC